MKEYDFIMGQIKAVLLDLRDDDNFIVYFGTDSEVSGRDLCKSICKSSNKKYYAFYTEEDAQRMKDEGRMYIDCGFAYGYYNNTKHTQKSYDMLAEVLKMYGFEIEWNGKPERRIKVTGIK